MISGLARFKRNSQPAPVRIVTASLDASDLAELSGPFSRGDELTLRSASPVARVGRVFKDYG